MSERRTSYKNNAKLDEMRRKRGEVTVQLRKAARDEQLCKRRNVDLMEGSEEEETPAVANIMSPIKLNVEEMIQGMQSGDTLTRMIATRSARKMLSKERHPPIDKLIEAGVVPLCVRILEDVENPNIQFEAAWALTNIASGNSDQTMTVIKANAIPKFVQLLHSPHIYLAEQATWALGNIAGDGAAARDLVLNLDALPQIISLITPHTPTTFLRNIVWAISNLCRNKNPPPNFEKIKISLPVLAQLIYSSDVETLGDICWALSYVSDGHNDKIQAVVDTGVVPRLVELLDTKEVPILTAALRTVGNIATGNDLQTDCVIQAGVLTKMKKLFKNKKQNIIKEAAWTVSNITAGNPRQIEAVIQEGLLTDIVELLNAYDAKIQKEAAWIVTNFTTSASKEQISLMINAGVIEPFCSLLNSLDVKTILVVLEGIDNMLELASQVGSLEQMAMLIEESGGLDLISRLQCHENDQVYAKCFKIISFAFSNSAENSLDQDQFELNQEPVNGINF